MSALADADDVRRIATSLPDVVEISSAGFDFRVANKGFVWSYPERLPGRPRQIRTDIAVVFVGDEAEKQALLLGEPDLFFTAPGYEGAPLVMLWLAKVGADRLDFSPMRGRCAPRRARRASPVGAAVVLPYDFVVSVIACAWNETVSFHARPR